MSPKEWDYLDAGRLPWPAPWADLFGRSAPLWMEIGFGNGQFLLSTAEAHPGVNLVGLEISRPSLRSTRQKLHVRGLRHVPLHVRLVHGNAQQVLWTLFPPRSLDAVFVNFPDPWPKAAHHKRRLIDDRFLALLASRLPCGGRLEIATDHAGYAQVICERLQRSPHLQSQVGEPYLREDPDRIRTKYERYALDEGRRCYYFKWQRNEAAARSFPIPKEFPVPHLVMYCPLPLPAIMDKFAPSTQAAERVTVRFIDVYRAQKHEMLLVDTYVDEPSLSQRLGLTIRPRQNGEIILGVHELGFPRPTAGVHRALDHLSRQLQTLHPEARVVSSNLMNLT